MSELRNRLTYANVVSTLALIVAVDGATAFAATNLPKNSVGTRELKPKAVKTGILAPKSVRAGKIAKNSITTGRLRNNAVTGSKVDEATLGTVPSAAKAANASLLDGLGADEFARAAQIDSGSGNNAATAETTLLSLPEAGIEIRTDGDADETNQLRFVNTRESGTFLYWTTGNPNAVGTLPAGADAQVDGPIATPLNHEAVFALQSVAPAFAPSPVVTITCRFSVPPTVACIGIATR